MATNDILIVVREVVLSTMSGDGLRDDEDLFDAGATSLTVVSIQLRLEERLRRRAPTYQLMASPSIHGFATIYANVEPTT